jgi:hypothetical protein
MMNSWGQTSPPGTTIEAPKPKIVGFIYEKGCIKQFDLYLFLDNNKIVHIDESNTPGEDVLRKLTDGVQGFNRIFACGLSA